MDCFGTYSTHFQSCDYVRVQRAAEWIASVHTLHVQSCDYVRVQSATEWVASVHISHMSKAVITFVSKCCGMHCFGYIGKNTTEKLPLLYTKQPILQGPGPVLVHLDACMVSATQYQCVLHLHTCLCYVMCTCLPRARLVHARRCQIFVHLHAWSMLGYVHVCCACTLAGCGASLDAASCTDK